MDIKVKTRKIDYEISFDGKYVLVVGDSATGKTTFHSAITVANTRGNGTVKVECEYPVVAISKTANSSVFNQYHNTVLVIDENCNLLHHRNIASLLRESDNWFIILTRKKIDWLPISVDSVFTMEKHGRKNKFVVAFPRTESKEIGKVDTIITEDSKSSNLFFKAYFPKVDVISGKSKSEISTVLKTQLDKDDNKSYLVVYDASAFGAQIADFSILVAIYPKVKVLDWESFEHYILASELIGEHLTLADTGNKWESLEQLSTARLRELIGYNKSQLPNCLALDRVCSKCMKVATCKYKTMRKPEELFIYGPVATINRFCNKMDLF